MGRQTDGLDAVDTGIIDPARSVSGDQLAPIGTFAFCEMREGRSNLTLSFFPFQGRLRKEYH